MRRLKRAALVVDGVRVHPRRAGQYAREMTRRKARRTLVALAAMIATAAAVALVSGLSWLGIVAIEVVLIAGLLGVDRVVVPVVELYDRLAAGVVTS